MIPEVERPVHRICAEKLREWLDSTPEQVKAEELRKWIQEIPEPVREKYPRDTSVVLFLAHKYLELSGGSLS